MLTDAFTMLRVFTSVFTPRATDLPMVDVES